LSDCAAAAGERVPARAFGGLELWCVDAHEAGPALRAIDRSVPLLSDEERRRAAEFADPAQSDEWLAAHIALRLVLERVLGKAARGVAFARTAHGKPRLDGAPVAFSLAHIPGLALIALSGSGAVGVDLERARAVRVREPRRSRIEAAGAALNSNEPLPGARDARFLQAWVRLEAFAKAEGCGVGRLLTRLGINGDRADGDEDFRARIDGLFAENSIVAVRDVALGDGLFAAVASGAAVAELEVFRLPAGKSGLQALLG
jgi:phosphopantetheinyl transferase